MIARRLTAAALAALLPLGAMAQPPRDAMLGTWRGTSLCVNREALPACTDEQVIYEIKATPGKADELTVSADKIVDGRREPMGEIVFRPDAATGRWAAEIKTPRVNALWYVALKDGALSGGMVLLPLKTAVRAIELRRDTRP